MRIQASAAKRANEADKMKDGGTPGWTVLCEFEVEMAKENVYWRIVTCKHAQIMPHTDNAAVASQRGFRQLLEGVQTKQQE